MEERVDKVRSHLEELWHLALEQLIVVLILLRCNIKVLLDLHGISLQSRTRVANGRGTKSFTVKRAFSSFKLFSFFSRSLFKLLLCRSKSTSLWSLLTHVLRIFLQISCSSLQGLTIRESMSSSSGERVSASHQLF